MNIITLVLFLLLILTATAIIFLVNKEDVQQTPSIAIHQNNNLSNRLKKDKIKKELPVLILSLIFFILLLLIQRS